MNDRKNTALWYKDYFAKAILILIIVSFILIGISCGQESAVSRAEYLSPQNLHIAEYTGSGEERTVNLVWGEPDTKWVVFQYIVYKIDIGKVQKIEFENDVEIYEDLLYKNAEKIGKTTEINYKHIIGNNDYCFFVTGIYKDDTYSEPSNITCSGTDMDIPDAGSNMDIPDAGSNMEENNKDLVVTEEEKDSDLKSYGTDAIINGPCGNPYYPILEGISYAYQVTGTRSWIQTHTIIDVSEEGFTEEVVQDIVTNIYEWKCLPEGLVNTYGGSMITKNDNVATSSDGEGITIPASLSIGDTWTQTCQLVSSDGKGQGELHRSLTFNRTAAAVETVIVPAGTFEAIRVDYDLETEASMETYDDHSLPLAVDYSSGSEWYVENIGLIKKTAGVKLDRMDTPDGPSVPLSIDIEVMYELIEYNIPEK